MKNNLTELVFILDKSGSMSGLENDTIGGFNSMLKKQQELEGDCKITTVLFDNDYELLHDRIDIRAVKPIGHKEYQIGGSTALLDAMGRTINKIIAVQKNTARDYQADQVIFVIITDGEENSSREYSSDKIKAMIEKQKSDYKWEFIFLAANIDAVETASNYGIDPSRSVDYIADSQGTELNFKIMAEAVANYRQSGEIKEDYLEIIREDSRKRKKED